MNIAVYIYPSSTWVLEGDTFFCTHDEVEIEHYEMPYMSFNGVETYESDGYVCADCGQELEGSPAEDRAEALAEMDCD